MPETPELAELLRAAMDAWARKLRVGLPGRVLSYNAGRETVNVTPQIHDPGEDADGEIVSEALPVIPDVPICWPSGAGGGCYLTFPLAKGDPGLLVFLDYDPGMWRSTGQPGTPGDQRSHRIGNAVFYPGLRANGELLGSSKVHASKLVIGASVLLGTASASHAIPHGDSIKSALDTLTTAISTYASAIQGTADPANVATPVLAAAIAAFQAAVYLSTAHKVT